MHSKGEPLVSFSDDGPDAPPQNQAPSDKAAPSLGAPPVRHSKTAPDLCSLASLAVVGSQHLKSEPQRPDTNRNATSKSKVTLYGADEAASANDALLRLWSLEFESPLLEQAFCDFLARANFSQNLLMHIFYVTGIQLAFTIRCIQQAPPTALGRWSCEKQKAVGAVLAGYPCKGPFIAQLRHILTHTDFYFIQRLLLLRDWGALSTLLATLLVTSWLLLLAASGAQHRPTGRLWRTWLRWRCLALTVTPLLAWSLTMPYTALLVGEGSWWRLGSYSLLMGAVTRPVWDAAVMAFLVGGGMRLRVRTMAPNGLLRAVSLSFVAAYIKIRDTAQIMGIQTVTASSSSPAAETAVLHGTDPTATPPPLSPYRPTPLSHIVNTTTTLYEWLMASGLHLTTLLPLTCLRLSYWWWSERAMRARFLTRVAAASDGYDTTYDMGRQPSVAATSRQNLSTVSTTTATEVQSEGGDDSDDFGGISPSPQRFQETSKKTPTIPNPSLSVGDASPLTHSGVSSSGDNGGGSAPNLCHSFPAPASCKAPSSYGGSIVRHTSYGSSGALTGVPAACTTSVQTSDDNPMNTITTITNNNIIITESGGDRSSRSNSGGDNVPLDEHDTIIPLQYGPTAWSSASSIKSWCDGCSVEEVVMMHKMQQLSSSQPSPSPFPLGDDESKAAVIKSSSNNSNNSSSGETRVKRMNPSSPEACPRAEEPTLRGFSQRGGNGDIDTAQRGIQSLPPSASPPPLPQASAAAGVTASPTSATTTNAVHSPPPPRRPPQSPLSRAPLRGTLQASAVQMAPEGGEDIKGGQGGGVEGREGLREAAAVGDEGRNCSNSSCIRTPAGAPRPRSHLRYRALTRMQTLSVKVHHPTGTHDEYAARLTAAVAPLLFPHAQTGVPHSAARTTAASAALTPYRSSTAARTPSAHVSHNTGKSTHRSTRFTEIDGTETIGHSACGIGIGSDKFSSGAGDGDCNGTYRGGGVWGACGGGGGGSGGVFSDCCGGTYGGGGDSAFSGSFVVVSGCVQLIAWVRGVDGSLTQQLVEVNEELAAAMGLDEAAMAALLRQGGEPPPPPPEQQQQPHEGGMQQLALMAAAPPPQASGQVLACMFDGEMVPRPDHGAARQTDIGTAAGNHVLQVAQLAPNMPYDSSAAKRYGSLPIDMPFGTSAWPFSSASAVAVPATSPQDAVSCGPLAGVQAAIVQHLPDAPYIGPWAVQGPTGHLDAYCNQRPILEESLALPHASNFGRDSSDSFLGGAAAARAGGGQSHDSGCAAAVPVSKAHAAAMAPLQPGFPGGEPCGPITIECAWTPCVPIAPATSLPTELELGLKSAVAQTLRLLLVRHGVLLADFTCVLGEGAQVLMLPVPPQPRPAVLQLVFAPAAGAATPNSPLLYDIATLLSVPAEVATELAALSQVMRMEYGSSTAAAAVHGGAAWRDHYAPLISDLAYLMECAELAAAAAAPFGADGGENVTAMTSAAATGEGPVAVLRVAQQLIPYLETNAMHATAQFVVRTVHEALQLRMGLYGANGAEQEQEQEEQQQQQQQEQRQQPLGRAGSGELHQSFGALDVASSSRGVTGVGCGAGGGGNASGVSEIAVHWGEGQWSAERAAFHDTGPAAASVGSTTVQPCSAAFTAQEGANRRSRRSLGSSSGGGASTTGGHPGLYDGDSESSWLVERAVRHDSSVGLRDAEDAQEGYRPAVAAAATGPRTSDDGDDGDGDGGHYTDNDGVEWFDCRSNSSTLSISLCDDVPPGADDYLEGVSFSYASDNHSVNGGGDDNGGKRGGDGGGGCSDVALVEQGAGTASLPPPQLPSASTPGSFNRTDPWDPKPRRHVLYSPFAACMEPPWTSYDDGNNTDVRRSTNKHEAAAAAVTDATASANEARWDLLPPPLPTPRAQKEWRQGEEGGGRAGVVQHQQQKVPTAINLSALQVSPFAAFMASPWSSGGAGEGEVSEEVGEGEGEGEGKEARLVSAEQRSEGGLAAGQGQHGPLKMSDLRLSPFAAAKEPWGEESDGEGGAGDGGGDGDCGNGRVGEQGRGDATSSGDRASGMAGQQQLQQLQQQQQGAIGPSMKPPANRLSPFAVAAVKASWGFDDAEDGQSQGGEGAPFLTTQPQPQPLSSNAIGSPHRALRSSNCNRPLTDNMMEDEAGWSPCLMLSSPGLMGAAVSEAEHHQRQQYNNNSNPVLAAQAPVRGNAATPALLSGLRVLYGKRPQLFSPFAAAAAPPWSSSYPSSDDGDDEGECTTSSAGRRADSALDPESAVAAAAEFLSVDDPMAWTSSGVRAFGDAETAASGTIRGGVEGGGGGGGAATVGRQANSSTDDSPFRTSEFRTIGFTSGKTGTLNVPTPMMNLAPSNPRQPGKKEQRTNGYGGGSRQEALQQEATAPDAVAGPDRVFPATLIDPSAPTCLAHARRTFHAQLSDGSVRNASEDIASEYGDPQSPRQQQQQQSVEQHGRVNTYMPLIPPAVAAAEASYCSGRVSAGVFTFPSNETGSANLLSGCVTAEVSSASGFSPPSKTQSAAVTTTAAAASTELIYDVLMVTSSLALYHPVDLTRDATGTSMDVGGGSDITSSDDIYNTAYMLLKGQGDDCGGCGGVLRHDVLRHEGEGPECKEQLIEISLAQACFPAYRTVGRARKSVSEGDASERRRRHAKWTHGPRRPRRPSSPESRSTETTQETSASDGSVSGNGGAVTTGARKTTWGTKTVNAQQQQQHSHGDGDKGCVAVAVARQREEEEPPSEEARHDFCYSSFEPYCYGEDDPCGSSGGGELDDDDGGRSFFLQHHRDDSNRDFGCTAAANALEDNFCQAASRKLSVGARKRGSTGATTTAASGSFEHAAAACLGLKGRTTSGAAAAAAGVARCCGMSAATSSSSWFYGTCCPHNYPLVSRCRVLRALRDCCLGFDEPCVEELEPAATANTAAGGRASVVQRGGRAHGGRILEAAYGLYNSRQALAQDGYTLAYICAKSVVCLLYPYMWYGSIDRNELLMVGPHLLLRALSFASKAVLLSQAACRRCFHRHTPPPPPPPPPSSTTTLSHTSSESRHATPGCQSAGPGAATAPSARPPPRPDPSWAVAGREAWVLGCTYVELAVLLLPMALGWWRPPGSLVQRLRGLGFEVLMDGIQRNAFYQVRTRHRLPQHTLHCALLFVLAAFQLRVPHALAQALLVWVAGFVTSLVVEVLRRMDFAVLHCPPPREAAHGVAGAVQGGPQGASIR